MAAIGSLVLLVAVLLGTLGAEPAGAHAVLVSATPAPGALLDEVPRQVVVTFNEPVGIGAESLVVIDSGGSVVSSHPVAEGSTVVVELTDAVQGWHAASWRVVSADGHPLSGAWTFRIGEGSAAAPQGLEQRAAASVAADPLARAAWTGGQVVSTLAVTVLAGTLFLAVAGIRSDRARRAGLTAWSALVAALASVVAAAANGPFSVGGSSTVDDLFTGPASDPYVARAVAMAVVAAGLVVWGTRSRWPALAWWLIALVGLVVVPLGSGHAATEGLGPQVAVAAHLVVAACWLGAIPALLLALRRRQRTAGAILAAFSRLAGGLLAATLVIGSVAALLLSGGPNDVNARWGWLLVAKVVLVGVAVAAGAVNRREAIGLTLDDDDDHEPHGDGDGDGDGGHDRHLGPDGDHRAGDGWRGRRRWPTALGVEVLALVGIVGLSVAMTHNGPPRRPDEGPVAVDLVLEDDLRAQLVIDPAEAGPNWVHLYLLDRSGLPRAVEEVEVSFASPQLGIEPIRQELSDAGNGHHLAITEDLGLAGPWEVAIRVRLDRFSEATAQATVDVGS